MSFLRRIWSKKADEDYETVLSNLANDIQKRQVKLSEIRLRERRSTLLVTLYTLAVWVAYVSLWYMGILPSIKGKLGVRNLKIEKAVKAVPVVIGPVIILFIRRIVQIWYERKGNAEEKTLQQLMKQRRDKVEEIKKKTNYYSTRDLLQKYDDVTPAETPLRRRNPPVPQNPFATPKPGTPQLDGRPLPVDPRLNTPVAVKTPVDPRLALSPSYPVAPPKKQWYDKVADALLGDDDHSYQSPSSRYALICEKCFTHNGLVKESMWEDAQYVCPKCNHFNASVRSKKLQRQGGSPSTPVGISRIPSQTPSPQSGLSPSPEPLRSGQPAPDRDLPTVDNDVSNMEVDE
ncbi:hypothetical protein CC1G_12136 [Coprinopsis cinerea okayama7|uniref:Endoplasmic reticulum junction formation protein lunapark n=1 Tax=Coprinopsis cinerea (strain Okayama-7 / 130 / ATCC MYA-4618 / FGSC 9003) TaxID=240176 RepID=A8P6X3_COPC7|nr:hypothetical protein CC1G_12136 [Coprinopsis cinerea okayama7\|eukprot:XP_001839245.1 hypothetical protein CC1G_12136 [Coprinopsis cinerea okayama7\